MLALWLVLGCCLLSLLIGTLIFKYICSVQLYRSHYTKIYIYSKVEREHFEITAITASQQPHVDVINNVINGIRITANDSNEM